MASIKTIAYNSFEDFDYQTFKKESFLPILKEFKESGGNLDFPIKEYDKIQSAYSWFSGKYGSDNQNLDFLFDEGILTSPVSFNIKEGKIIISDLYNTYWFRDNTIKHKTHIENKMSSFLKEFKLIKDDISSLEFTNNEKLNTINGDYKEVLFHLLNLINLPKAYDEAFTIYPEIKSLWLEEKPHSKFGNIGGFLVTKNLLSLNSYRFSNTNILDNISVFYKHDIIKYTLLKNEEYNNILKSLIEHEIYSNNLDFIKEVHKLIDLKKFEDLNKENYDGLISKSRTKEMTELLLSIDLFVYKDSDNSILNSRYIKNDIVLDTILSDSRYTELLNSEPYYFYKGFIVDQKDTSFTDLLIDKYNLNILKFDMLDIGFKQNGIEGISHYLNKGADPRNCEEFISNLLSRRDISTLKKLKKENIFNAFYPDPLYYILNKSEVKENFTWISKVTEDDLKRNTMYGQPAWWGIKNKAGLNIIKPHIKDFNDNGSAGGSYFTNLSKNLKYAKIGYSFKEDSYDLHLDIIKELNDYQIKNNLDLLDITHIETNGNNLFHNLFLSDNSHTNQSKKFIDILLSYDYSESNIGIMLSTKNKNELTPIEIILNNIDKAHKDKKSTYDFDNTIISLLTYCKNEFDYGHINNDNKSIVELLSGLNNEKINHLIAEYKDASYIYYSNIELHNELAKNTTDKKEGKKIKI